MENSSLKVRPWSSWKMLADTIFLGESPSTAQQGRAGLSLSLGMPVMPLRQQDNGYSKQLLMKKGAPRIEELEEVKDINGQ